MNRRLNQHGFTIVEGLILFVIVAAIAGIGYLVYQRQTTNQAVEKESAAAYDTYVKESTADYQAEVNTQPIN